MIRQATIRLGASSVVASSIVMTLVAATPAQAQQRPAAPAAATPVPLDPAQAASKAAFERLEEAERKAIQNDLIWSGDFNGVAGGEFGRRTYDALIAFERRGGVADGILNPTERQALKAAADAARARVQFTVATDAATGISIGLPRAILTERVAVDQGVVYRRKDGQATLQLSDYPRNQTLAELWERLNRDGPGRKVTYRLQRPDWFVLSGEEGTRKFYTRIAQGAAGLRGYTFRYPAAEAAAMDRLMIAMANTFEPFPGAVGPGAPIAQSAQPQAPALMQPRLFTEMRHAVSGVVVANGKILTSAVALRGCAEPTLGGQPVTAGAIAVSGDLAIVSAATGTQPAMRLGSGQSGRSYTLSFEDAAQRVPVVSPGALDGAVVRSALQVGPGGAPVIDTTGNLVAIVRESARPVRMVAGVAPEASHAVIPHATLAALFGASGLTTAGASGSRTLAEAAASLVEIRCARRN